MSQFARHKTMMITKDFEIVAAVLADEYSNTKLFGTHRETRSVETVILKMADSFENNYPRFNRMKFLRACGYGG